MLNFVKAISILYSKCTIVTAFIDFTEWQYSMLMCLEDAGQQLTIRNDPVVVEDKLLTTYVDGCRSATCTGGTSVKRISIMATLCFLYEASRIILQTMAISCTTVSDLVVLEVFFT